MARLSAYLMSRNIRHVYSLALASEIAQGQQWYPLAHGIVRHWADTFERSIANVACIVAALSPQVRWDDNLALAADVLAGQPPSRNGYIRQFMRIAERIRDDHATDTLGYFKVGCKVRSFAANLAGNFDIVTVDTHAAQIAAGDVAANLRIDTWARYEPVASAYVETAHALRIKPAHLQAVTWLAWKRIHPPDAKRKVRARW